MKVEAKVIEEAGYNSAIFGLTLYRKQPLSNMPNLAKRLCDMDGGHNKFLEHIIIWVDINAPRYMWQEIDTYRVAVSKQSEGSIEVLKKGISKENFEDEDVLDTSIDYIKMCVENGDFLAAKKHLPEGFMQRREVVLSYKTLRSLILQRRMHWIPHWKTILKEILSGVQHPEFLPKLKD